MYRNCIFCSAQLGANDALEHFPVGRSVAFDAARGRLWAVCPSCARWNLSPIEERWETIEQGERLFRDSRVRAQSENVGVARLRDGTRLIRVGNALPGELAVWRYGQGLLRRRRRMLGLAGAAALVSGGGLFVGLGVVGLFAAGVAGVGGYVASSFIEDFADKGRERRLVHRVPAEDAPHGRPVSIHGRHLVGARLVRREGEGLGVILPALATGGEPLVVAGTPGRRFLSRAMVQINAHGGRRDHLQSAVEQLSAHGTAEEFLRSAAEKEKLLLPFGDRSIAPADRLALEMAVHEDAERRALAGELAGLEEMWRQAEEIADLADTLPDVEPDLPPFRG
jgi:hypothetical protein